MNLNTIASFTWSFNHSFFVETNEGNFVWSDPEYGGDNTIRKFNGDYKKWCKKEKIPFGRDKGMHTIGEYCGHDVKFE